MAEATSEATGGGRRSGRPWLGGVGWETAYLHTPPGYLGGTEGRGWVKVRSGSVELGLTLGRLLEV